MLRITIDTIHTVFVHFERGSYLQKYGAYLNFTSRKCLVFLYVCTYHKHASIHEVIYLCYYYIIFCSYSQCSCCACMYTYSPVRTWCMYVLFCKSLNSLLCTYLILTYCETFTYNELSMLQNKIGFTMLSIPIKWVAQNPFFRATNVTVILKLHVFYSDPLLMVPTCRACSTFMYAYIYPVTSHTMYYIDVCASRICANSLLVYLG